MQIDADAYRDRDGHGMTTDTERSNKGRNIRQIGRQMWREISGEADARWMQRQGKGKRYGLLWIETHGGIYSLHTHPPLCVAGGFRNERCASCFKKAPV